jgi:hypothetical protein
MRENQIIGARRTGQCQCPRVRDPFDECYCNRLDSLSARAAIYFCGGNFIKCEYYRRNMAADSCGSRPPEGMPK